MSTLPRKIPARLRGPLSRVIHPKHIHQALRVCARKRRKIDAREKELIEALEIAQERMAKIRAWHEQGYDMAQIGYWLGISRQRVWQLMRDDS